MNTPSPTFAFFGTPGVARDTLAILLERGLVPALVVTAPDAARGRGLVVSPSPVRELAEAHHIPVLTPATLDEEAIAAIRAYGAACAVVVAYGKIFPQTLIDSFPLGALNVHYSLLPKYRGATPLEAALLAGDAETGVTVQKMVYALDAGDIIAQKATPIGDTETARELRPRLITLGAELLADTLSAYARGEIAPQPQDHTLATHTKKFKKEDGLLALDAPAQHNWNTYRAYADTIGTHFFRDGKRIKITEATFKDGEFIVLRVVPEGKKEMTFADFTRKK